MSYSFLIEMAWKSALISGAALLLVTLLRSRSAADRGAVLRVGVLMLLSLPGIALLFPGLVVETPAEQAAPLASATFASDPLMSVVPAEVTAASSPVPLASQSGDWNDPTILFLLLYLGGVAMVGGRLLAGLWTLRRWTAEAEPVTEPDWIAALARAETDGREIRLLVSPDAASPLSWGLRHPVILLDLDTLRRPEDAEAILAHEVAHIVAGDWASLMLSRIGVALFWFNPLVWRLDREVAQQAEEAADSRAAERVEPARYAQTLLEWARHGAGMMPANAMAGSEPGLSRRIRALLDGRFSRRSGSRWASAAMIACAAIAAPVAALEFVAEAPEDPQAPAAPAAPAPHAAGAPRAPGVPAAPIANPAAPAPIGAKAARAAPAAPAAPMALAAYQPEVSVPPLPPVPPAPLVDGEAISAAVRAAVRAAAAAHAAARIDEKAIEAQVRRSVAASLRSGAEGMERSASGMEAGAQQMRSQAAKLRDPRVREAEIRRAAARGDHVTHEDLIEAAEGLEEGAEGMLEGARDMRRSAKEMRRGG